MVLCPECGCGIIQVNLSNGDCTCLNPDCKHKFVQRLSQIQGEILKND